MFIDNILSLLINTQRSFKLLGDTICSHLNPDLLDAGGRSQLG